MGILVDEDTEVTIVTPLRRGVTFAVRPSTTDALTVLACCAEDEYHLPTGLAGWALDVGAHIGGATLALLLDNPDLRVVAIEPLPENVALLHQNLDRNHVADRCEVIEGAAANGADWQQVFYGTTDTVFARGHQFIGNGDWQDGRRAVAARQISLASLGRAFSFMKIDCEGGEWSFLDDAAVADVAHITGEWHRRGEHGLPRLHELLDATHVLTASGDGFGPFEAVRR